MNMNSIVFYDFETGSINRYKTQPIQLAAVAINSRTLEIFPDGTFNSLIKPLSDEDAVKANLDPLEDGALKVNGKNREELAEAPELKIVWTLFTEFVGKFNAKKSKFAAPIPAGFNINNFDNEIINRLCKQYGPYDDKRNSQKLFHPIYSIDIMTDLFMWTENNADIKSISMDAMREWLGIDKTGAHDALKDVMDGASILIRFLKLYRHFAPRVKFEGSFAK